LSFQASEEPHNRSGRLDNCVKYSASDARQLGLNTHVILDGCRGIELEPGDIGHALDEMKRAGAVLLKSGDL
jgi:nicotinamidase/pyrazinamidase